MRQINLASHLTQDLMVGPISSFSCHVDQGE